MVIVLGLEVKNLISIESTPKVLWSRATLCSGQAATMAIIDALCLETNILTHRSAELCAEIHRNHGDHRRAWPSGHHSDGNRPAQNTVSRYSKNYE